MKNALGGTVGYEALANKPVALLNASPRAAHAQRHPAGNSHRDVGRVVEEVIITLPLLGSLLDDEGIVSDPQMSVNLRAALAVLCLAVTRGLGQTAN
jgi:hypothetical protein